MFMKRKGVGVQDIKYGRSQGVCSPAAEDPLPEVPAYKRRNRGQGTPIHRGVGAMVLALAVGSPMMLAACTSPADHSDASPATGGASVTGVPAPSGVVAPPPTSTGRSTAVPAPGPGTISDEVPSMAPGPLVTVSMTETADVQDNVSIQVDKASSLVAKAQTPGEISGPAIAFTVSIHNGSGKPINIDSVMATLLEKDGNLGMPTTSDPYHPFSGDLAPGASAEGTYIFLTPIENRQGLTFSVEYLAGSARAQFIGDVP